MTEKIVENGHFVKVHYTGTFTDGTVFDTSDGKQALEVLAGKGMLIKGFDDALVGMKVGDEKEIDIPSDKGYGERREELVKEVSKKAKVSQKAAADVIAAALETIQKTVSKGKKVTLVGFGTFEPRKRAARIGRNPQTGAAIQIAAARVPNFKAGNQLKAAVAEDVLEEA
jgi:DNA-binding protein HU-beta